MGFTTEDKHMIKC